MLVDNISEAITNPAKTSVSPLPTSAFPIDARTYFESYADAQSAAATAKEQGSKETIYYFGMTLVVFENDKVHEYIIIKNDNGIGELREKIVSGVDGILEIDGGGAREADPNGNWED